MPKVTCTHLAVHSSLREHRFQHFPHNTRPLPTEVMNEEGKIRRKGSDSSWVSYYLLPTSEVPW